VHPTRLTPAQSGEHDQVIQRVEPVVGRMRVVEECSGLGAVSTTNHRPRRGKPVRWPGGDAFVGPDHGFGSFGVGSSTRMCFVAVRGSCPVGSRRSTLCGGWRGSGAGVATPTSRTPLTLAADRRVGAGPSFGEGGVAVADGVEHRVDVRTSQPVNPQVAEVAG